MKILAWFIFLAMVHTGVTAEESYVRSHGSGRMALSPNGAMVAFHDLNTPANSILVYDVANDRAYSILAPEDRGWLTRPNWTSDGNTLTMIAADAPYKYANGSEVWAISFGSSPSGSLLMERPDRIFSAVLSDDKSLLGFAGSAYLNRGDSPYDKGEVLTLYEFNIEEGNVERRADAQFQVVYDIDYDSQDRLYLSAYGLKFPTQMSADINPDQPWLWGNASEDGRSNSKWERENNKSTTFRVSKGETLAEWPRPYPPGDKMPFGAQFVTVTVDDKVVFSGNYDPNNSFVGNRLRWYGDKKSRKKYAIKEPYVLVIYEDGTEVEIRPYFDSIPDQPTSGGSDLSMDMKRFAKVGYPRKGKSEQARLTISEESGRVVDMLVSDLRDKAETLRLGDF